MSTQKVIAFRVDASVRIASGHVMRCLTLADGLRELGYDCHFICRTLDGHLMELIEAKRYSLHALPAPSGSCLTHTDAHATWLQVPWQQDAEQTRSIVQQLAADMLIVDHYAVDANWQQAVQTDACALLVIDDLADKTHHCDLLLSQNILHHESHYQARVPAHCKLMLGAQYLLLRPEFASTQQTTARADQTEAIKEIFISMGGVDAPNYTGKVLSALARSHLSDRVRISVVMGAQAVHKASVEKRAASMAQHVNLKVGVSNMAQLMASANMGFATASFTAYELAALKLPMCLLGATKLQQQVGNWLQAQGICQMLTTAQLGDENPLQESYLLSLIKRQKTAHKQAALSLDGLGVKRVTQQIQQVLA